MESFLSFQLYTDVSHIMSRVILYGRIIFVMVISHCKVKTRYYSCMVKTCLRKLFEIHTLFKSKLCFLRNWRAEDYKKVIVI